MKKLIRACAAALVLAVAEPARAAAPAPAAPAPAAGTAAAVVPPDDAGQDLYNARCAACHGRDGKAKTPIGVKLKTKDLTEGAISKELTPASIAKVVEEGTADKKMPAYQGRYSTEEMAALVKYLRAFNAKVY